MSTLEYKLGQVLWFARVSHENGNPRYAEGRAEKVYYLTHDTEKFAAVEPYSREVYFFNTDSIYLDEESALNAAKEKAKKLREGAR